MTNMVTAGSLGVEMISKLTLNARDVGSIPHFVIPTSQVMSPAMHAMYMCIYIQCMYM